MKSVGAYNDYLPLANNNSWHQARRLSTRGPIRSVLSLLFVEVNKRADQKDQMNQTLATRCGMVEGKT